MEELVGSVNAVTEVLKNGTPNWVSIIISLIPIILTVITIILSWQMDKRNKELQKIIHNRDVLNQSRQDILSIYNSFSDALLTIHKYGTVATVFCDEQNAYIWGREIRDILFELGKACDKAKLLFDDETLNNCLISARNAFQEIDNCVSRYIYNNTFTQVLQSARSGLQSQYGNNIYNSVFISQNTAAREQLIKLCENENTREIEEKINHFSDIMKYENFDIQFRKYLMIKENQL